MDQGNGRKDPGVKLSPGLLDLLCTHRPKPRPARSPFSRPQTGRADRDAAVHPHIWPRLQFRREQENSPRQIPCRTRAFGTIRHRFAEPLRGACQRYSSLASQYLSILQRSFQLGCDRTAPCDDRPSDISGFSNRGAAQGNARRDRLWTSPRSRSGVQCGT